MFFSIKLKKFKNLKHCFFSRNGGYSKGIYKSLNCGMGSKDKKEIVLKNLELISKKIGCKKESLITLNQKHSNNVIFFKNKKEIKNKLNIFDELEVMGPVESPISKVKRKFRSRLLLRFKNSELLQKKIANLLNNLKISSKIKLTVDVDPVNFT